MVLALLVLLPVVSRIKLTEECVIGLFGTGIGLINFTKSIAIQLDNSSFTDLID